MTLILSVFFLFFLYCANDLLTSYKKGNSKNLFYREISIQKLENNSLEIIGLFLKSNMLAFKINFLDILNFYRNS